MNGDLSFQPGSLVSYRNREWVVLPSDDQELLLLKPLGGSDEEITGVYKPFVRMRMPGEEVTTTIFLEPTVDDRGAFDTARLLYDATRLTFRNAVGPFRSVGKLSFRPRAYQMVPLVLALRQDVVRLMIADDVGIGKTIEALIILQELMDRGEVKRFSVICPPHLCEQWQSELKDKLDIDAVIIRTSTAASLDRKVPDDRSVFYHFPYQVISIDYLKSDKRKQIFLNDCPELVIVDEAHTCAKPEGAKSKNQQLRYSLVHDIAANPRQHLIMLTATPHSGKDKEFLSLMALLDKKFENLDFENLSQRDREQLSHYFIQRKREHIQHYMNEDTSFPEREMREIKYTLSDDYLDFYERIWKVARELGRRNTGSEAVRKMHYWAALSLLRGVMSSPDAGKEMLRNKQIKLEAEETELEFETNPVFDQDEQTTDEGVTTLLEKIPIPEQDDKHLSKFIEEIQTLRGPEKDNKLQQTIIQIDQWTREGFSPIVFCKYIATAKYVGEFLQQHFGKKVAVEVVTSELPDERRKEVIDELGKFPKRVLVATDCLSEGINLQEYFNAVLHYDLPWNPNRLEQRNGRVDRFGQTSPEVKSYLLYGQNNPIDQSIFEIIIQKIYNMQRSIGTTIPLGETEKSIIDEMIRNVFERVERPHDGIQLSLFEDLDLSNQLESARQKAIRLRNIFAHTSIDLKPLEDDLKQIDFSIGNPKDVERFVIEAIPFLKGTIEPYTIKKYTGYKLDTTNLPDYLKQSLILDGDKALISFESPTPSGFQYIGRKHKFVEQLSYLILSMAFEKRDSIGQIARVAEIRTDMVARRTVVVMLRVRNVLREEKSAREIIGEEIVLWGMEGIAQGRLLSQEEARLLLEKAISVSALPEPKVILDIKQELSKLPSLRQQFEELVTTRNQALLESHTKYRKLLKEKRVEIAEPVLPPDILGLYIFLPVLK